MMLVELEAGDLYVVAADAEWKESTSRYGGIDALILEAVPRLDNLLHCRHQTRSRTVIEHH